MAFNRLADVRLDALNPRTSGRALPAGLVSANFVVLFVAASSALLVVSSYMLNRLAFLLSPVALAIVFLYSFTKRYTWGSHFVLGVCLACAPVGAWIAVRGNITTTPLLLGLSVVLWVSGLDIIYACQDLDFDRRQRLHSIPVRFGLSKALWISALLHAVMVASLAAVFLREGLGTISLFGLLAVTLLLAYEHSLVRPTDLSSVNTAFFTVNGWISILLFVTTSIDILMGR